MPDNLRAIKERFDYRLTNSDYYDEFLKHHEPDIADLIRIVKQQQNDIKEWERISDVKDSHLVRNGKEIMKKLIYNLKLIH